MNYIWDMGGVVVQWNPLDIISSIFNNSKDQEACYQHLFNHPDWQELDRGAMGRKELCLRCAERSDLSMASLGALMEAIPGSLKPLDASIGLIADNPSMGHRNFFLSNMPEDTYLYLKENYSFWKDFENGLISALCRMIKPNEDIFHKLLNDFHLDPLECLFIDDSLANIETARRLQIPALHYNGDEESRDLLRQYAELSRGIRRVRSGEEEELNSLVMDFTEKSHPGCKKIFPLSEAYLQNHPVFMLEEEGKVKAFYSCKENHLSDGWSLDYLLVHPDETGKGIEGRLFRQMSLWAEFLGLDFHGGDLASSFLAD